MEASRSIKRSPNLFDQRFDSPLFLRYRIAGHIAFWIGMFAYEVFVWGTIDGSYYIRLVSSAIEFPIKIIATYFTLYFLIDKFLIRKKYGLFLVLLLVSMAFFGIALRILAYYTIYPLFWPEAQNVPLFFLPKILIYSYSSYSLVGIMASFHLIRHWFTHQQATQQLQQTAQQLEKEKIEAELKLLKSQINPHFLFNTLNNLYVLTLNQSHKAPEMVYKLSQLMSYMLYDCNQPEVPLKKEIEYIENHIALEKVRYDSRLDVSFNVYDDVEGVDIAPLLILPFVENSFKHGVSNQLSHGWIRIDLSIRDNTLVVKVENSKVITGPPSAKPSSGVGLTNVKKRLDIIYPDRYDLQLLDEEETYLVVLRIDLRAKGERKHLEAVMEDKD